ncbi:MAG: hypothetical protein M3Y55_08415 [Pseudomonadota bacterium]|nr:hypothetical protein [Pseudomonadota bacterium]
MGKKESGAANTARQRWLALSRWENEGGAWRHGRSQRVAPGDAEAATPVLCDAELVQMKIRIIALENLVIALLADAPQHQLELVRDMAAYISPRPGFTAHPLTLRAAAEMVGVIERAGHFRTTSD